MTVYFCRLVFRSFARLVCHLCSSRSTSDFGTATTRLVKFCSRSMGVRPAMVTFISFTPRSTRGSLERIAADHRPVSKVLDFEHIAS
jgi:hypothetical protein